MKTPYNEIVNIASIGSQTNPISLNEILRKANDEQLTPAAQNKERVLFLGIDVQQDFMDNGALGVPGAHGDVERMTQFIYNNMDKITNIAVSIDTHTPHQIFHPCWWIDENGNNPVPYTPITLADLDSGKYRAVIYPRQSRDYVEHLEKDGKPVTGTYALDSDAGKGTKTGTVYFDGEDGATLTLKHGESAYITGIAAGTTYTVEETAYEDWVPSLENGTALTGTITADTFAEVKVKNTYEPVADLTVAKTVKGSMGNKNQDFAFTLSLTAADGDDVPDALTCEKEGKEITLTKDADSGTFHFTLSHKESIRIKDIRKGTTYTLSESGAEEKGYTVTCDAPTGTIDKDTEVHFTNERKGSVPTLADMNTVVPAVMVLLAVVGMAVLVVKNRKKKKAQ